MMTRRKDSVIADPQPVRATTSSNRVIVACADESIDWLTRHYPKLQIAAYDSYLKAIRALDDGPVRAFLMGLDSETDKIESVVAAVRQAISDDGRLILCCRPQNEPAARRALQHGADDYALLPLEEAELDAALAYGRPSRPDQPTPLRIPSTSDRALRSMGLLIGELDQGLRHVAQRLCESLADVFDVSQVLLVIEGDVFQAGDALDRPVLAEPVEVNGTAIGQISLGERPSRSFESREIEMLRLYADFAGQLIKTARQHEQWQRQAMMDELSTLPNRRRLLSFLDDVMRRAMKKRLRVTLLLFDIDDFKTYNDRCGHQAGDEIIRTVAHLLRRHCRQHDLVARYGGDEFAVVFWDAERPRVPGSKHPTDALAVLQRFREALASSDLSLKGIEGTQLTISGGLASFPWDANTPDQLISKADSALMEAKRAGKNRIFLFGDESTPPMDCRI